MAGLEERLVSVPSGSGALVVVDGVFSVDGDIANLPDICALAKKYGAAVMVDDAHGFGVLGDGGRGTASHFGLDSEVDIVMGTFSKSLASLGGFAAGKREVIDFLRHSSYPFVFSASLPPANAAAALAAVRYLKRHPELTARLRSISEYTRSAFASRGIPVLEQTMRRFTPIIPIHSGGTYETCAAAKQMFDAGVFVNPFIPPATPEGAALIRTSVTAAHTPDVIDEAADVIAKALGC
jgi:7-keto-8-aminopelargonate synthetase-like enzyme